MRALVGTWPPDGGVAETKARADRGGRDHTMAFLRLVIANLRNDNRFLIEV